MKQYLNSIFFMAGPVVSVLLVSFLNVPLASAQALDVQFEQTPLFSVTDITPGHGVARTVTVTNNSSELQKLYTSAINTSSTGLADIMTLSIHEAGGPVTLASTTFTAFFGSNPIFLGQFAPGDVKTYIFNAYFDEGSVNTYQATTMQFNIAVGFMDGAFMTDNSGGNSGGGGKTTPHVPPGQVAGMATDTLPLLPTPTWLEYLQNTLNTAIDTLAVVRADNSGATSNNAEAIRGQVSGVSTSTDSQADTTSTTGSSGEKTAAEEGSEDISCTFIWLLLLVALSLVASFVDDILRHKNKGVVFRRLFVRQLVFSGMYIAAVAGAYYLSWLDSTWYWFAGAWALMQIIDYRSHTKEWKVWNHTVRLVIFGGGACMLLVSSLIIDWPCVSWPFVVIGGTSVLTYLLNR